MSRVRSDIPIYAFTRHERTRRRVTLYRGVYPVAYDIEDRGEAVYFSIFRVLLGQKLVSENDNIILTKGELSGISGGTNSMQILRVTLNRASRK
jgi:pyruvate kinase